MIQSRQLGLVVLILSAFVCKIDCNQCSAVISVVPPPQYRLDGTLDEGGSFFGFFTIDPLATDSSPTEGIGNFALTDVNIHLQNSSLFSSGGNTATSGSTTEALLTQSEFAQRQAISFTIPASNGLSNVFSELVFEPFTGDADIAVPLEGVYTSGLFDGNGQDSIATISVTLVPEPSTITLLLAALIGLLGRPRESHL